MTTMLKTLLAIVSPLWLAQNARAAPRPREPVELDAATSPSLAPSFVDLSAIVSLLAADTVEDKLVSPSAPLWERMSTMWTLFGLVGAVRAYAKLALGLGRAEAAGVNLGGGGAYTTVRTKMAKSFRRVEGEGEGWWQDDRGSLLQTIYDDAAHSRWQRPIVIIAGYARCPFAGRRASRQVAQAAMNVAITIVLATIPLATLRLMEHFMDHIRSTGVWTATLVLCFTSSAIAGCAAPLALVLYTTAPFARLKDNHGREFPSSIIHPNDSVMTAAPKGPCFILWQDTRETPLLRPGDVVAHRRPGDLKRVRFLAALASVGVLAYYILNYVTLSSATTLQSYVWLGLQIVIMSARFVLWSSPRPFFDHSQRHMTVLYVVAGSLSYTLPASGDNHSQLTGPIVNAAVALAGSLLNNVHGSTAMLRQPALVLLADAGAPADILRANYVDVAALHIEAPALRLIRLPWSFMEQLYTVEGLILGKNPWSYGGLYLAACLVDGRFVGLTTVFALNKPEVSARFLATVPALQKDDSDTPGPAGASPGAKWKAAGITRELCVVDDLVNGSILGIAEPLEGEDYERWHVQFRKNVAECRAAAVPNGPEDVEVHTRHAAPASMGSKHVTRTENSMQDALAFVRTAIDAEKSKDHSHCKGYCMIDAMNA
ncbi:hypothetical protein L226DRAFT_513911 [Lentinus tigrinus ALCF2SS1-7]|uniref:Uncharacterized protein n=1 Tax=Lentinus tigrinus ALCF2SS1-6 TaxID=1328759 RepID=A0A5C2S9A7_9APHY|nr:hypothetical protein L227DRAFT_526172 [Lentinus tigrinus ALCF2SS1-6]RPD70931.1 hypothetical protein L226DRAFT_513911 [Lentinus tigrinus ALCF2SS1-7]